MNEDGMDLESAGETETGTDDKLAANNVVFPDPITCRAHGLEYECQFFGFFIIVTSPTHQGKHLTG